MIRVLIIHHIRLYREQLAAALDQNPDVRVVAHASDLDEAIGHVRDLHPQVALIDAGMTESFAILRAILQADPTLKVVAIGVPETEHDVLAFAEAGVAGYLLTQGSLAELIAVLRSVDCGEMICSPKVAATLLRRVAVLAAEHGSLKTQLRLTPREIEIVLLIDRGLSNKEIGRHLSIKVHTVKNHVHNILEKMQIHRRTEAAALARAAHPRLGSVVQAQSP